MLTIDKQQAQYAEAVSHLGDQIGFGNMMHLARDSWREKLHEQGISGGEFAVGPCVALTVPCGCAEPHRCDWCNGCGWIVPLVKTLRDRTNKGIND